MNIEKHKHLFTDVSEGLPELNGWYLCITSRGDKVYEYFDCLGGQFLITNNIYIISHWLDLSKLTTKERTKATIIEILSADNPWPVKDVLKELVMASEILLIDHDHDGLRHEEIRLCIECGREIIKLLSEKDFINEKQEEL